MDITVSICCLSFNHESFIRGCLDGFLMQKTNFKFEVLIHDDASTDNTQQIIKEYEKKYPEIIKPICQQENQYSKLGGGMNLRYNFPRCRGKYIALCEGDDYWTDPLKLQKQVDFMEQNPDYKFSMGKVNFLYEKTNKILPKKEFVDPSKNETYTLQDYLKQPFSQTSSFLFRNENLKWPAWLSEVMAGDQSMVIIITGKHGKIKFHNDYFSVYQVNEKSLTQGNLLRMLKNNFKTFRYWNEYLDYEYKGLIRSRMIENYVLYYLFRPKFIRALYKNYMVESTLQFFYKGIMVLKNKFTKSYSSSG